MPTPLEVLDGALWLYGVFPRATDIYYTQEGWRLVGGGHATASMFDCVLRRDTVATETLGRVGGVYPIPDDPLRAGWVQLSKNFVKHGRRDKWTDGAAWAVRQASEIEYMAPDTAMVFIDHMWWCRGPFGECMLSSPIENRYHMGFTKTLDIIKSQPAATYPNITSWMPRAFLEAWPHERLPSTVIQVVSTPATTLPINMTVTIEEDLPPDLRGVTQLKGLTAQERRQAHTQAVLQDMLTRTAPPRYK